jgi:hypothetical protein
MYNHLVMTPDFDQIIKESLLELHQRVAERDATDKRIGQLTKALRGLAVMVPEKERPQFLSSLAIGRRKGLGLTEMILEILRDSKATPLSTNDIRDRMEDMGFDFAGYSQPTSTIYNTLRRLIDDKRVMPVFSNNTKVLLYKIGVAGLLKKVDGD